MPASSGGPSIADVTRWYLGPASEFVEARVPTATLRFGARRRVGVEALVAAHLGLGRSSAVKAYLHHRARSLERLGFLSIGAEGTELLLLEPRAGARPDAEAPPAHAPHAFCEDDGQPGWPTSAEPIRNWADSLVAGQIECDRLVVATESGLDHEDDELLKIAPAVVILVDASEAGQVAAYRALKRWHANLGVGDRPLSAFIVDVPDEADGHATWRRLSQLVRRFLGLTIQYAGASLREVAVRQVVAAHELVPGGRGQGESRWVESLREVIARVGMPPASSGAEGADPHRPGRPGPARELEWEIDFALPVEQPLRSLEQLMEFVSAHVSAFWPDGQRCERLSYDLTIPAAIARAVGSAGQDATIVGATGPAPGVIELILSRQDELAGATPILWIGHPPTREQFQAAQRLEMPLRPIAIRHVCVDGHLGVLFQEER